MDNETLTREQKLKALGDHATRLVSLMQSQLNNRESSYDTEKKLAEVHEQILYVVKGGV